MCAHLYSQVCMCAIYNVCLCLITTHQFVTYQCAILHRHDWSCACLSVHLEAEPCGHQGGDGQSMTHGKVHDALWIVTLCQGDVGKPGGLIDGSTSTHLVYLHQEPRLVLRLLQQHRWEIFISCIAASLIYSHINENHYYICNQSLYCRTGQISRPAR